jgi:hypothetical protein
MNDDLEQIAKDCYRKGQAITSFQMIIEVDGKPVKYCSLTATPGGHRKFCDAHGEEIKVRVPYKREMKSVYACKRDGDR